MDHGRDNTVAYIPLHLTTECIFKQLCTNMTEGTKNAHDAPSLLICKINDVRLGRNAIGAISITACTVCGDLQNRITVRPRQMAGGQSMESYDTITELVAGYPFSTRS